LSDLAQPACDRAREALVNTIPGWLREHHDIRGWRSVDNLARDVRYAARTLRRAPGFAIVVISSLGIGFALTTSVVAVVNAYLLRSLPYAAADRLYHVRYAPPGPWEPRGMSGLDWASVNDVVEFPVTAAGETFYLTDSTYAQSVRGLRVTQAFVEGLGVGAFLGRSLRDGDFVTAEAALIGYALWRDRYGSNPAALGGTIRAEAENAGGAKETYRIVGVLPPDFYYGREGVDLLVPLTTPARTYMVRLREGIPPEAAERRITEAAKNVGVAIPADWSGVQLESAHERHVAQVRPALVGVTVAAGLVLVIVCANVAVLMVLRTARRRKEMAVRAALGSGRLHLARLLLLESFLVCAAAMGAGVALTQLLLQLLAPLIETQLGRPAPGGAAAIAIDGTVLLVVGGLGLVIALSLSFLPLLAPWQHQLVTALRQDGGTTTDGRSFRHLRSGLVAFEVAGALILLVSCGLLLRSVVGMIRTDLGFEPEGLVRGRVVLRGTDYPDARAFFEFYEQFRQRLSTVTRSRVVFTNWPPFIEHPVQLVEVDERTGAAAGAGAVSVDAGYFSALGIPLRSGRDFVPADVSAAAPVAVISETLARRLWPAGDGIGRRLRAVEPTPAGPRPGPWRIVVGVAADVRQTYGDADLGDLYVPLSSFGRFGSFYIRTDSPAPSLFNDMRAIAADLDPHAVIHEPRAVEGENRQLAGTTFLTTMLTALGAIAGFLAILGIYGVTAYAVQQRAREIAIRVALGAAAGAVVRLFVKEGAVVLGIGLGVGLFGAGAVTRVLEHQLFGVRASDPSTLAATCLLLGAAGILATWWPAKRAALSSPIVALKEG
jgi:putative ABC transport system permease protein